MEEPHPVREETGTDPIRALLADDHDLVRDGIAALLETLPGVQVVGHARDGGELLEAVARLAPHIVFLDLQMPRTSGLPALRQLRAEYPDVRVIILTMCPDPDVIRSTVAFGAHGYLTKDSSRAELQEAVRRVLAGGSYFTGRVAAGLLAPGVKPTGRELEILRLVALGQSSKEIARELGIAPKTVDALRGRLMERLQVRDVAGLTRLAVRMGLVVP